MVSKEPTIEPQLASSQESPHGSSILVLPRPSSPSSPPTPTFDSSPAGLAAPTSPLVSNSVSSSDFTGPSQYPQSQQHIYLASSLLQLIEEREEEFHSRFGHLMGHVQKLKRENDKNKEKIKTKRDDVIMLGNLIRMQEKVVENLKTSIRTERANGWTELPKSVSEDDEPCIQNNAVNPPKVFLQPDRVPKFAKQATTSNYVQQLPNRPTTLTLKPIFSLTAQPHSTTSKDSKRMPEPDRRMPAGPVSIDATNVQPDVRRASTARDPKKKKKKTNNEKVKAAVEARYRARYVPSIADSVSTSYLLSRKAGEFSRIGDISEPSKGSVGLGKTYRGNLHDSAVVSFKRFVVM